MKNEHIEPVDNGMEWTDMDGNPGGLERLVDDAIESPKERYEHTTGDVINGKT